MLKGTMVITHFLLFIGSVALATILIYLMLYGGLGVAKSLVYYDARVQAEAIGGLISSAASHNGDFIVLYTLPARDCEIEISESKVKIKFAAKPLKEAGSVLKMAKSESEISIVKPNYIDLKPSKIFCDEKTKKQIAIQKLGNDMKVVE